MRIYLDYRCRNAMSLLPQNFFTLVLCILSPLAFSGNVDNSCPLASDSTVKGTFGDPCTAGRYCVRESTVSFTDNVCCPCPKGGFYCPGHKKNSYGLVDGVCSGEGESGDNAPMKKCELGEFADSEWLAACFKCEAGKFAETKGQTGEKHEGGI